MDLIYTNAARVDLGVLAMYALDLSYGAGENDFVLSVKKSGVALESNAVIYIENTEYGGIVDGLQTSTNSETVTYFGRTWHGILNSKVIEPDSGENYFAVSGDANEILSVLIRRLGLSELFSAVEKPSGINIARYQFNRYCGGYDGIRAMLAASNAKLKIAWNNRSVMLSAEPIADYSESSVDGDVAPMTIEHHETKVNHLICLGRGELAEREVIHLYADQTGNIGDTQYYFDLDEVTATYDNSNSDDLRGDGIQTFKELRDTDTAKMALRESEGLSFDIGDIVGATEYDFNISISAAVSQKIVRINNGVVSTEYKTGG